MVANRAYHKDGRFNPWGPDPRFQPDSSTGAIAPSRMIGVKIRAASWLDAFGMEPASGLDGSRLRPESSGAAFLLLVWSRMSGANVEPSSTLDVGRVLRESDGNGVMIEPESCLAGAGLKPGNQLSGANLETESSGAALNLYGQSKLNGVNSVSGSELSEPDVLAGE